ITTISFQEGANPYPGESGPAWTQAVETPFDRSEKVSVSRAGLNYYRYPFGLAVIYYYIDFIFPERFLRLKQGKSGQRTLRLFFFFFFKFFILRSDVLLNLI